MSAMHNNPGLEGNPHFVDVTIFEDNNDDDEAVLISAALTLAYEQRTANLIAMLGKTGHTNNDTILRIEIFKRMNLDDLW